MPDGFDTLAGAHLDSAPAPSPQVDNLIAQAAADDAAAAGEPGPIAGIPAGVVPLLGESWALDDGERARLTDALAAVYRKRGGVDVPPELALVGVLLSIALPRLLSTSWGARAVERLRVSLGATPAPPAPAAVEGRKRAA